MIYEYQCLVCGWEGERYVPTFDQADDEICACGERLERQISATNNISVWKHTSIPEIDPNIHFRGYRHAQEVARAKNLSINPAPLKEWDLEYRKRVEEKDCKRPISVDYGRGKEKKAS